MENSDRNAALLIAGDGVAFVAFAVVGLSGHERQLSISGMMRAGLPFLLAWLPVRLGFRLVPPIVADIESMVKRTHRLAGCLWSRPIDPEPCVRTTFRPNLRACLSGDERRIAGGLAHAVCEVA